MLNNFSDKGGTAGCVLASRLSESKDVRVLLIERGPIRDTFSYSIPLAACDIYQVQAPIQSWAAEPNHTLNGGKAAQIVAGSILGGASRFNAMLYVRGLPADYDHWRDMGHPEWSYEKILPYFVKSETSLNQPSSYFRGKQGQLA